jgi:hypothetical protein
VLKRHYVLDARVSRKIDKIPSCLMPLWFVRCILACEYIAKCLQKEEVVE